MQCVNCLAIWQLVLWSAATRPAMPCYCHCAIQARHVAAAAQPAPLIALFYDMTLMGRDGRRTAPANDQSGTGTNERLAVRAAACVLTPGVESDREAGARDISTHDLVDRSDRGSLWWADRLNPCIGLQMYVRAAAEASNAVLSEANRQCYSRKTGGNDNATQRQAALGTPDELSSQ